jgi:hypothetical protein
MNQKAFVETSAIEKRGMEILKPWIDEKTHGRYVLTAKGAMSRFMQLHMGDVIANSLDGNVWSLEIKIEEVVSPNFFIETWSNRNLEDRGKHIELGSNPGWLFHSRADILLYYFLNSDDLYVIDLWKLKRWAFGNGERPGRIYQFHEAKQRKREQKNDTWGRLVPVRTEDYSKELGFPKEVGYKHCKVRQLSLFASGRTI